MLKVKPKNGLWDWIKGKHYDIYCDCCKKMASGHKVYVSKKPEIFLAETGNTYAICPSCYRKGFSNLKYEHLHKDYYSCAVCQNKMMLFERTFNDLVKFVCNDCFKSKSHPANSHSFIGSEFGRCESCGTIQSTADGREIYWVKGSETPLVMPPRQCTPGYIGMQELADKCNDTHAYILIADCTKKRKDVKKIKKKDVNLLNDMSTFPGFQEMYPLDKFDLLYSRCGYKSYWCHKCGCIKKELPKWWVDII